MSTADPSAELQLQTALMLLKQAGRELSVDAQPGSTPWLQAVVDALCDLSSRDALTGLANRRQFELTITSEIDRVARAGESALVLMADIDHFKRVNDDYGHAGGDSLLCSVADRLRRGLRKGDSVLRWGGEEFLVCLPRTDLASATLVAYKMLDAVAHHAHALPDGRLANLTVSIGVAELGVDEPFVGVVERADTALYEAKRQGRNRVCQAPAMAAVAAGTAAAEAAAAPKADARGAPARSPVARVSRARASLP